MQQFAGGEFHFVTRPLDVSTGLRCTTDLLFVYMTVLVLTGVLKSFHDVRSAAARAEDPKVAHLEANFDTTLLALLKVFQAGKHALAAVPMACVLFLASRLRAQQLSQNLVEKIGLPQDYVDASIAVLSVAVGVQVVLVFLML